MAAIEIAPSFGGELKDGFKPVNAWVSDQHTTLGEPSPQSKLKYEHSVLTSPIGH